MYEGTWLGIIFILVVAVAITIAVAVLIFDSFILFHSLIKWLIILSKHWLPFEASGFFLLLHHHLVSHSFSFCMHRVVFPKQLPFLLIVQFLSTIVHFLPSSFWLQSLLPILEGWLLDFLLILEYIRSKINNSYLKWLVIVSLNYLFFHFATKSHCIVEEYQPLWSYH